MGRVADHHGLLRSPLPAAHGKLAPSLRPQRDRPARHVSVHVPTSDIGHVPICTWLPGPRPPLRFGINCAAERGSLGTKLVCSTIVLRHTKKTILAYRLHTDIPYTWRQACFVAFTQPSTNSITNRLIK